MSKREERWINRGNNGLPLAILWKIKLGDYERLKRRRKNDHFNVSTDKWKLS